VFIYAISINNYKNIKKLKERSILMRIYRVIYSSIYLEEGENIINVKTFLNKDLALNYIKKKIKEIKNQVEDLDDYCVEETEDSYERYLNGRSMEDSVAIWLEEDEFYDELELLEEKSIQQEEEKDYEM
jgi:hypothetical protein